MLIRERRTNRVHLCSASEVNGDLLPSIGRERNEMIPRAMLCTYVEQNFGVYVHRNINTILLNVLKSLH